MTSPAGAKTGTPSARDDATGFPGDCAKDTAGRITQSARAVVGEPARTHLFGVFLEITVATPYYASAEAEKTDALAVFSESSDRSARVTPGQSGTVGTGSWLTAGGSLADIQRNLRHSTPVLTAMTYVEISKLALMARQAHRALGHYEDAEVLARVPRTRAPRRGCVHAAS